MLTRITKTLYIVLSALTVAQIVLICSLDGLLTSSLSYAAAAISLIFVLVAAADNLFHHVSYLRPSAPAQLFIAWWLLSDITTIRTRWLLGGDNVILGSMLIALASVKLAVLLVEELSKRQTLLPSTADPPAEALSGIINRLLMLW